MLLRRERRQRISMRVFGVRIGFPGFLGGRSVPAGERERAMRTKSAKESSSWPIKEDFLRQRATLPSRKSKKSPKGINARATHNSL